MATVGIGKLFTNGRSQAVRLPREFRLEGDHVRIRRIGRGILLEPMTFDVGALFDKLDRLRAEPFMAEGRNHRAPPKRRVFR